MSKTSISRCAWPFCSTSSSPSGSKVLFGIRHLDMFFRFFASPVFAFHIQLCYDITSTGSGPSALAGRHRLFHRVFMESGQVASRTAPGKRVSDRELARCTRRHRGIFGSGTLWPASSWHSSGDQHRFGPCSPLVWLGASGPLGCTFVPTAHQEQPAGGNGTVPWGFRCQLFTSPVGTVVPPSCAAVSPQHPIQSPQVGTLPCDARPPGTDNH